MFKPPVVDESQLKTALSKNNDVMGFVKEGMKLLEKINQPNVITVEEFLPYVDLFKVDNDRLETDGDYKNRIQRLYRDYIQTLEINIYEPTLVVKSKEDQEIVVYLNRVFTRIAPDNVESNSARTKVPGAVSKIDPVSREDLMLDASLRDLLKANQTDEQKEYFKRVAQESQFVEHNFVRNNLSAQKREALIQKHSDPKETPASDESQDSGISDIVIDDDDV